MPDQAPTLAGFLAGWELFRDPILTGVAGGAVLGMLGVFVVLRRMVFISAALAQAAGLGVALSFFAQIHLGWLPAVADPKLGALAMTLLATALLSRPSYGRLTREGILGMAYLIGAAGTVAVGTRISQEAHDIQAILFGTGVLVRESDMYWILGSGLAVMLLTFWWRRGLFFASFDPEGARVRGLPVAFLSVFVLASIAVMVSLCTRALGALPVFAFSVLPAIAAIALAASPPMTLAIATALGLVGGGGGYLLAYFWELPVGASQTLLCAALAVLALALRLLLNQWPASRLPELGDAGEG